MKKNTKAIHIPYQSPDAYGALSMPVYHCDAYEFADSATMADAFCGRTDAPDYSRVTNPTVIYLEKVVKELTGARSVTALNSGMAAISATLFALASQGRNIVASRHLFANTFELIGKTLPRFGVEPRFVDLTDLDAVEAAMDGNTCCIFLETITNPQMEVADLAAPSAIAHRHGAALVADTTMIPFTEFDAKSLGVDVEVVSSTKYLSGGATSLGGLVIDYGTLDGFTQRIKREMVFNFGAYMTPHAAYMQTLGLETLAARYAVQSAGALRVAEQLRSLPGVVKVTYPGLSDNPYHDICRRQYGPTAGAMLTFDLESEQACYDMLDRLQLIHRATNLFDNRSLAIHPYSTIFGNLSAEERAEMNVYPTTIRLSIGLEDADDLVDDIRQAICGDIQEGQTDGI